MLSIPVDGADLFAVEEGTGSPIVLVHGSLADYRTWLLQTRELSGRHRVIAYSRRFHFPNDPGPGDPRYSVLSQALDLAKVIRSRANGSAHVVTSSYGGCVALCLAVTHPELIRSLVLCEPPLMPWLLKSVEGQDAFATVEQAQEASDKAFKAGRAKEGVRLFCDMAIGGGVFEAMPERSQARMMENAFELSLEMAAPQEVFFPRFSCEELRAVSMPVLLLGGDRSPSLYGMIMNELAKCLPRREVRTIPRASHIMHRMNPGAFNEAVLSFMGES